MIAFTHYKSLDQITMRCICSRQLTKQTESKQEASKENEQKNLCGSPRVSYVHRAYTAHYFKYINDATTTPFTPCMYTFKTRSKTKGFNSDLQPAVRSLSFYTSILCFLFMNLL
eukprot:TRINITY_DN13025_c0_g4_i1.p1 TRINITY_DN13025_c0_g4~~TRINITY_DN13025_c0_g4_i1.p1  ORF type:complete len:114 (+),score=9.65 TRINITY_DN13025_c0_g4_i1:134-475(+)